MSALVHVFIFLTGLFILMPAHLYAAKEPDRIKESYREMLQQESAEKIVATLLDRYLSDEATKHLDAFGEMLAVNARRVPGIFDVLDRDDSPEAVSIKAELLLWLARGDEMPRNQRNGRTYETDIMPFEPVCEMAAQLLDHPDPFVRGIAEFAISTAVGMQNNGPKEIWPTTDIPTWYDAWIEESHSGFQLKADYVRQCVRVGEHRTNQSLLASAQKIIDRLEGPLTKIQSVSDSKKLRSAMAAKEKVDSIFARMKENGNSLTVQRSLWLDLRCAAREVVMANPDLDFSDILLATRHAFHDGGNITAGAKSYIVKPGGDIVVKNGLDPSSDIKPLINGQLEQGHMRGMALGWDADKLVFAYAEQPKYDQEAMFESDQGFADKAHGLSEPVHLYEMNIDGTGLRIITDHEYSSDVEPAYLPNGDVVFCSDRSNFGSQCSGHFFQNKKIVNLYRVNPDGSNLRAISNNKDFDRHPHVLDDGQILFTRWEYQERHLWQVHNLWSIHPDGTLSDAKYKQHINTGPMALRDARQIPGSHKLVAIACGHHEFAQGAVTIIDHHQGLNNSEGMRLVTPHISPREGGLGRGKPVASGGIEDRGGLYQQPYALSEDSFLVSYSYYLPQSHFNAVNFGLYYIDGWGNKELIHREPILSVFYPIPIKKQPRPRIIPDRFDDNPVASVYATDVHSGVPEITQGTIKYIRIGHRTEWPVVQTGDRVVDYNHLHYTPSGSWSRTLGLWTWTPARVIGTVPVEDDGSAYFNVPTNVPLYFQALDENYMEVRRMRSWVIFQPGEVRGCTGCHESRDETPLVSYTMPKAVARDPSMPVPPSWGAQDLPDFERHIQPIMDKYCVKCHGENNPAAGLEFGRRQVDNYFQSYRTMFGLAADEKTPFWETWIYGLFYPDAEKVQQDKDSLKLMETNKYPGQLVSISNRFSGADITKPYEFGSHKSKLITTLLEDSHRKKVFMAKQDWIDLVTWVDLNAPYWGSFVDKEPIRDNLPPKRIFVKFPEPFLTHYPSELEFSEKPTRVYDDNIK